MNWDDEIVFWDMDGVVANFNGSAKGLIKAAGLPTPHPKEFHYLHNHVYYRQHAIVSKQPAFWRYLEPFTEAIEAFKKIEHMSMVLSSPAYTCSATPKLEWCEEYLDIHESKVILASAKHLLAGPKRWLVDDKAINCKQFVESGGRAILIAHDNSYADGGLTEEDIHNDLRIFPTRMDLIGTLIDNLFIHRTINVI